MSKLENIIKKASQDYYSNGTSELTDPEFDALLEILRKQDPDNPLFSVGHGYDISKVAGTKVAHKYGTVGSLLKCRTWDELEPEFKCTTCDVSLKLDGISVVLYYEHGWLIRALTRGDGKIGIDITTKVRTIDSTYNHIVYDNHTVDFTGAVRGEILMSYDNFDRFNKLHPEAKNPRNSTAGLISSNEITDDFKLLSIIVYTIIGDEGTFDTSLSHVRLDLRNWFGDDHVVPYSDCAYFPSDTHFIDYMDSYQDAWYGKYPADGLVISLNDVVKNPNNDELRYTAMAFKFPSEVKKSEVIAVNWEMSKSGYAVPVVNIKPVELAGTVVQNASGFNAAYIRDNNIGPGSWVEISKHGEIIPNIDKVVSSTEASLVEKCPACGLKLAWYGVHLKCDNHSCINAVEQDTLIWLDHICPIDNLGDKLRLKYLNELFNDDITIEHIMAEPHINFNNLDTSGHDKLIHTMLSSLYSDDSIKLSDALLALNIPRLGEITAKKLAIECPETMHTLVSNEFNEAHESVISIVAGPATANSIKENLDKYRRLAFIEHRIDWSNFVIPNIKFNVAITGKLSVNRAQFEKELASHGYKLGELNKSTKYLITDNVNSGSSKNIKADKLGVEKISESDFRSRFF